jgi:hypothetical protein
MALLGLNEFMQMSPIFIAVFMLMTSMFNGDVKALIWLGCVILGVVALIPLSKLFILKSDQECTPKQAAVIDIFSKYPNLSVSTFFIIFTLMYLILPMQQNQDWNYYVIVGFLGMLIVDTLFKLQNCTTYTGIVSGAFVGGMFSLLCYGVIRQAGGDQLLYFNTVSSNNIYCSRPKKQQFKCYVYKNGEIISTM